VNGKVHADVDGIDRVAWGLHGRVATIRETLEDLDAANMTLDDGWDGRSADAYFGQVASWRRQIDEAVEAIEAAAELAGFAATQYREADKRAADRWAW
jgi:WXG100 family type VII secretion target